VTDATRIEAAKPLDAILAQGGSVMFRETKGVEKYSLKHILKQLQVLVTSKFVSDCIGKEAENLLQLETGVLLLENTFP
jgi:hypothetical protein